MKEIALQVAAGSPSQKLNVLREYIQNEILLILQTSGLSDHLYFVGGTALRFLYGANRFSEDLEFSAGPTWRKRTLGAMAAQLKKELTLSGYAVEVRFREEKTVARAYVRFGHILQEAALSLRKGQVLTVDVEIDTNPPPGWAEERTIVNRHFAILLRHYDQPSLFASKIAAFLTRPYTKGRDVYDLIWFRTKWPDLEPNLALLNNALAQKRKAAKRLTPQNWTKAVAAKASGLDWKDVVRNVFPFLEGPREASLLTLDSVRLLYRE